MGGVKWACCNVGASSPEEWGGYYAWGETEVKQRYDWSTYLYCNGNEETCQDIGKDIAGTNYDVAHVKWGGGWQMPGREQMDSVRLKCIFQYLCVNGVYGVKMYDYKNNFIFLPFTDFRLGNHTSEVGYTGYYWFSYYDGFTHKPEALKIGYSINWQSYDHCRGFSVRPVLK